MQPGSTDVTGRYAPPTAQVADVADAAGHPLASRGARFAAAVLDTLLMWAVSVAVLVAVAGGLSGATAADNAFLTWPSLIGVGALVALQCWLLYQRSQTVGKIALKIRIVRSDGSHASFGRTAGLRYLLFMLISVIPFIGPVIALVDVLFIFGEDRRCLHDRLADTIVVNAS